MVGPEIKDFIMRIRRTLILAAPLAAFALLAMGGCGGSVYAHSGYQTRQVHRDYHSGYRVKEVYRYRAPAPCPPPRHHHYHHYRY